MLAVTAWRLLLASRLGLAADEAYYAAWAERPAWGYHDHPPGIAWLGAVGMALGGRTELALRAPGILLQGVAMLAVLRALPPRARGPGAVLLAGMPALFVGGLLATPDAPLTACTLLAAAALLAGRPLAGAASVAGAGLAKLSGWLLLPVLALRARRAAPALLAVALALPHLAWLAAHGGAPVAFQLRHGLAAGDPPGLAGLAAWAGGQLALGGPIVAPLALVAAIRGHRTAPLGMAAALVLGVFAAASPLARGELNWSAPAWALLAPWLATLRGRAARAAWVGGWTNLALCTLLGLAALRPPEALGPGPLDRLRLGPVVGPAVEAWGLAPVLASRYQEASWVRFYGGIDATTLPGWGREDQFDDWPRRLPEHTVYVRPARGGGAPEAEALYREVRGPYRVEARRGPHLLAAWEVFEVRGLRAGATGGAR